MSSFERLIREHDEIGVLAERLHDMIASQPHDPRTASALLEDLSSKVRKHLLEEDRSIYTVLIEMGSASHKDALGDLEAQFQELSRDWLGYLNDWSAGRLEFDWNGFCTATRTMMSRLRQRVRVENELIYPAALRAGVIQLRDVR